MALFTNSNSNLNPICDFKSNEMKIADQLETESEDSGVNLKDLPVLPFEKPFSATSVCTGPD